MRLHLTRWCTKIVWLVSQVWVACVTARWSGGAGVASAGTLVAAERRPCSIVDAVLIWRQLRDSVCCYEAVRVDPTDPLVPVTRALFNSFLCLGQLFFCDCDDVAPKNSSLTSTSTGSIRRGHYDEEAGRPRGPTDGGILHDRCRLSWLKRSCCERESSSHSSGRLFAAHHFPIKPTGKSVHIEIKIIFVPSG